MAQKEMERELAEESFNAPSIESTEMASMSNLLSRLSEEGAQAFTMHYIEGLPTKSIAQQLGCSSQSIKQRLYRVRKQLQQEVLKMVKNNVEKEKLPGDFPQRVVANLLETGRKERLYMDYDKAQGHFQEAL